MKKDKFKGLKVLVGISGCGKSTYARKLRTELLDAVIVNPDSLREQLFGFLPADHNAYYEDESYYLNDKFTFIVVDEIIQTALDTGKSVIVDATNLSLDRLFHYRKFGVPIQYIDVSCSVSVAIYQDSLRDRVVGEELIRQQAERMEVIRRDFEFGWWFPEPLSTSTDKPYCIVVDMDGTLAIHGPDRDPYSDDVSQDILNERLKSIMDLYRQDKISIIVCTARKKVCEEGTKEWLALHSVHYDEFYIREAGDQRKDFIVKEEMWRDINKDYHIIAMFDDRNQVVRKARSLGLPMYQIRNGPF